MKYEVEFLVTQRYGISHKYFLPVGESLPILPVVGDYFSYKGMITYKATNEGMTPMEVREDIIGLCVEQRILSRTYDGKWVLQIWLKGY